MGFRILGFRKLGFRNLEGSGFRSLGFRSWFRAGAREKVESRRPCPIEPLTQVMQGALIIRLGFGGYVMLHL